MSQLPPLGEPVLGAALDLDGVLVDGMPYHFEAFDAALKTFGVNATRREIALLEGMRTREVIKHAANMHDVFPAESELDKAEQLKRELYSKIFRPQLMQGAEELIEILLQRHCRLAIVTGTAEASARAAIRKLNIEKYIEVVISHDSGMPLKPHPAPFAAAVQAFSIAPRSCVAVENAPPGVTSAVAAGLRCLAVASYLEKEDLQEAECVFDSVCELNSWLSGKSAMDSRGVWLL